MTRRSARSFRPVAAAALAVALSVTSVVTGAATSPAGAQTAALTVDRPVVPAATPTTVTVTGTNYQVPPHAPDKNLMGGVYVLFGWVQPGSTWGPSNTNGTNSDGQFGITYSYIGERGADTRDDGSGLNRFVSFTAGGVSGESTSFHMTMQDPPINSQGTWSTTITVPGSVYQWTDPVTQKVNTVDCLQVQCGVYTIGAHGIRSRPNEQFTPITFMTGGGPAPSTPAITVAPPASGGPSGGSSGGATSGGASVGGASTSKGSTANRSTTTVKGAAATTAPVTTASPGSTVVDPTTAPVVESSTTEAPTSTSPSSSTTRRSDDDETSSASGRVIVYDGPDGGGPGGLLWGAAVGVPLLAAGGLMVVRRRRLASAMDVQQG